VQRGSRVKKGQLLAVLENKDLALQRKASKGDLDQAEASYVTTVNSSLPQQIQKAELDAAAAKAAFDAQQKVYDSRKDLFQTGRAFRVASWTLRKSRLCRPAARMSRRKSSLRICSGWANSKH